MLADRIIAHTGVATVRDSQEQSLDTMELECERGITIKAQAIRKPYTLGGITNQINLTRWSVSVSVASRSRRRPYASPTPLAALNLIDTPGHVHLLIRGVPESRASAVMMTVFWGQHLLRGVSYPRGFCQVTVLLIDATQGIQAQTVTNVYLALEHDMAILPAVNLTTGGLRCNLPPRDS